jgi:hypothetical protein
LKTYIRLKFNSRGTKPSEVYRLFKEEKFLPTIGEYDFVYDWGEGKDVDPSDILEKLDSLHNMLKGLEVIYEVTTSDPMYHIREVMSPTEKHKLTTTTPLPSISVPSTPKPQPPPPQEALQEEEAPEPKCPKCGANASYIKQYDRFYCYSCKKYV